MDMSVSGSNTLWERLYNPAVKSSPSPLGWAADTPKCIAINIRTITMVYLLILKA